MRYLQQKLHGNSVSSIASDKAHVSTKHLPTKLIPHRGIDVLSFGESVERMREILGNEDEIRPCKSGKSAKYIYERYACTIEVSQTQGISAFQFSAPAIPMFDGENLLALPFSGLVLNLTRLDKTTAMHEDGMVHSPALGIASLAAHAEEAPHKPADAILLTCKGYWNED